MSDLDTAMAEFFARVDRHTPDEMKRVRAVLESLLRWSTENSWGISFAPRNPKGPIRFCVEGVTPPFWVLTPHTADGARLTLMTAAHPQFPDDLRDEARKELAQLDGRTPEPDEVPRISCAKLLWPPYRDAVFALMTRALNRVHGRTTVAETAIA